MNKAYKFRIYPNSEQQMLLAKTFGCVRFIYNRMLGDKIKYYEETKQKLSNTPAQYKAEFAWLREVDSLALANAQMNLQTAYNNFFHSPKTGFPKFKSKHKHQDSYTTNLVNGNIKLQDKYIILPKLKSVKIKQHRQVPQGYRLKSVTISKTASSKYFASILFAYDQRKLSKMQKGSNNRNKQRKDFLYKLSRQITNAYDVVCVENLDMKAMSQALNFGKSVSDNGWGMFTTFLGYKLAEQGKQLIKIDKWFPSSKTCSCCGTVKKELTLSERIYHCESCGAIFDRDLNAAINIRNEGMRLAST